MTRRKEINELINKLKVKTVKAEIKALEAMRKKAQKGEIADLSKDFSPKLKEERKKPTIKFSDLQLKPQNDHGSLSEVNEDDENSKSSFGHHSAFEEMDEEESERDNRVMSNNKIDVKEIYHDSESKDNDSVSNSYQSKIFGKQNLTFNADKNTHRKMENKNVKTAQSIQIKVGNLDSISHGGSSMNIKATKPLKSAFAKKAPPPPLSASFSHSAVNNQNDSKSKLASKQSWGSSSSVSSESDEEYDEVKLRNQLSRLHPLGKTKSFAFDFLTDRHQSVMPQAEPLSSNQKAPSKFTQALDPQQHSQSMRFPQGRPTMRYYSRNDPEIYKSYMHQIKSILHNIPSQEDEQDKLDKKSVKAIKKIIKLENYWFFHF